MRILTFIKGYRRDAVLAPLFKLSEAVLELFVPIVVASLIDTGIAGNDPGYVVRMALLMVALGAAGLIVSVTAQYFAARAATGFAEKMKNALYEHISSLSESDRDRIGTNTLITRLTSDSTLVQNGFFAQIPADNNIKIDRTKGVYEYTVEFGDDYIVPAGEFFKACAVMPAG